MVGTFRKGRSYQFRSVVGSGGRVTLLLGHVVWGIRPSGIFLDIGDWAGEQLSLLQGSNATWDVVMSNQVGRNMDKAKVKRIAVSAAAVASVLMGVASVSAQDARIKEVVEEVNQSNKIAQASQERINGIQDATGKLLADYRGVLKTNAGLEAYNKQQNQVIENQLKRIAAIKETISQIDEVKRQVTPLMIEMIDNLDTFVKTDIPFQIAERQKRIDVLREAMTKPNVSDPERFRIILEAYKAEVQYGRTLNVYEGDLENDGRSVNFVRVGRVGFYYQTKNGEETGIWDTKSNSWVKLDSEFNTPVGQLMKMARRQVPLNLLVLPLPTAERASQ